MNDQVRPKRWWLWTGLVALGLGLGGAPGSAAAQAQPAAPAQPSPTPPPAAAGGFPASFADLAESQLPTVVNISTTQEVERPETPFEEMLPDLPPGSPFEEFFREFWGDRMPTPRDVTALGSGFIISPDGHIVTNYHVVAEATEIQVILHDETTLQAELVGGDPLTDLAVLKVEAPQPLPAARWGDSDAVRVGDWVVAIGNPFGLGGTVTAGILSARARDIRQGPYDEFLQTDAAINRGNSGGPLFAASGEVIGVNTAIFSPTGGSIGIGFAIPSNLARDVVQEILEYGEPRRGWLGVQIQEITPEIAEGLGLQAEAADGALVVQVTPGSPAAEAGLQQGDVIISFNNQQVTEMRELPRLVADTEIGATVPVVVLRDGEQQTLSVTIGDLQESDIAEAVAPNRPEGGEVDPGEAEQTLGLAIAPITPSLRATFDIPDDVNGVVVTGTAADSPAAEQGLDAGDVIVEVDQEPVQTPEEVVQQINQARAEGKQNVLMLVSRNGDMRFVPLPLG